MTDWPHFLGVGAGKTGTTWLRSCLRDHPEVSIPGLELDFFSRNYDRGGEWYRSFFDEASSSELRGEISPSYLLDPRAPARIREWNPEVRLIFSFRDPIERAYSHYCMHLRGGVVGEDVDRVLGLDTRYVREGLYDHHSTRYLEVFDESRTLFLFYDDLRADPAGYYRSACRFLGIDPGHVPPALDRRMHPRRARPRLMPVYRTAVAITRALHGRSRLARRLLEQARLRGLTRFAHRLFRSEKPFPELSAAKRAELADFYAADVRALQDRTGRDLSAWLRVPTRGS